ncbi:hypothetical protein ACHAC9_24010 [Massilia sp. CMS3.1]|uniref:hypothetical protein n=1 Tax=Massilia sp. CMS3.1 TaxID=3373083 RepID=UPI003EE79345
MTTRIIIVSLFVLAAVVTLAFVYMGGFSPETSGILANLGTGFFGTATTVLVVDWLYERRAADDQCKSLAFSILLELDHAVWVWQGGSRAFNLDELYSNIIGAEVGDPLPNYTQNLFMRLGTKCATNLNLKASDLKLHPPLATSLGTLAELELIRDYYNGERYTFTKLQTTLASVLGPLATVCGLGVPILRNMQTGAHRTTSEEHQHFRHFGKYLDGTSSPILPGDFHFGNNLPSEN